MGTITEHVSEFECTHFGNYRSDLFSKRKESKFILNPQLLENILERAADHYNILEVKKKRVQQYRSLYFDDEHFSFYKAHHNGELNRFKVRLRKYNDHPDIFLEVKYKNNKYQKKKWRIKTDTGMMESSIRSEQNTKFINQFIGDAFGVLLPRVLVAYERITLVPKNNDPERITIDFNIRFNSNGNSEELTDIVIVEIKQKKICCRSPFFLILRSHNLHPLNFSKYCLGINYFYPHLKNNRFKPRNLEINKVRARRIGSGSL